MAQATSIVPHSESFTKCGWLRKESRYVKEFRARFCEVQDGVIRTYKEDDKQNCTEEINIRIYEPKEDPDNPSFFQLHLDDDVKDETTNIEALQFIILLFFGAPQTFTFQAETPDEAQEWIIFLRTTRRTLRKQEILPMFLKKVEESDAFVSTKDLADIEELIAPEIEEAQEFTRQVLSEPCSGRVSEKTTAMHILGAFSESQGKEALFFDGDTCENLPDSLLTPHIAFHNDTRKIDVHLADASDIMDDEDEKQQVLTPQNMNSVLKTGEGSRAEMRAIETLRQKLARVHGVDPSAIEIHEFYEGSFAFKYTVNVSEMDPSERRDIEEADSRLKQEFNSFKTMKIHALFYRTCFDVNMFDEAGNKDFARENATYTIGEGKDAQEYEQPVGWYRYGLKVLYPKTNKYGTDNTWLDPFFNPNMWHKAYHGTGAFTASKIQQWDLGHKMKPRPGNNADAQLAAVANIYEEGLVVSDNKNGTNAAHGPGVYCAESVKFYTESWGSTWLPEAEIVVNGKKEKWQFLIMVAVRPGSYKTSGDGAGKILVVKKKEDVRPYGIIFRKKP